MPEFVITPLAAFGLATAILNYLISTAQNLYGKYHEFRDFPKVFKRYGLTVHDCLQSYDLWLRLWHRPNEASYNELFGVDGWIAIKSCRQDVEELILETVDILCLRVPVTPPTAEGPLVSRVSSLRRAASSIKSALKSPAQLVRYLRKPHATGNQREIPIELKPGDPDKWQIFTRDLENFLTTYQPDELVLKRIVGVLGPNENLNNKIASLEKAVASLAKRTSNAFQLMGHGQEPKESDEIDVADDAVKFRAAARNWMELIRDQGTANGERGVWFLELEFPNGASDGSAAIAQIIRNCSISFVARTLLPDRSTMTREVKMKRLRGLLETEVLSVSELAVAIAELHTKQTWTVSMPGQQVPPVYQLDWSYPPFKWVMKDWRTLLGACSGNQGMRKALELERAHFALGLTLWFILLWETEWFSHVCSCAFRCVIFSQEGDERRDSATEPGDNLEPGCRQKHFYDTFQVDANPTSDTPVATGVQRLHLDYPAAPASCRGQADLKDRLYHFGILLAELALAMPIQLSSDLDQVPRANTSGRPVGRFNYLREIQNHKDIPAQLKEAIEFCFEKATDKRWAAETRGLAAQRMSDFLNGVVKPVKQYYDVVKKNFKYAREFTMLAQDYQDDNYEQFEDAQE